MYIALPTMATSNAMLDRIQEHMLKRLGLPAQVRLVHGQSFLKEDDLAPESMSNLPGEVHPARDWFSPKKKALLAPFGVGTIDQAELTALNVPHNTLRMIGLAGKVVILDEVHAYDTYMTTIVKRMVEWLASLGSSIILLSATLPQQRRAELAGAFSGDAIVSLPDVYPNLFVVNEKGETYTPPAPIDVAPLNHKTVHVEMLHFSDEQAEEKARWLLERVRKGGCVAWITNTVGRAQAIFKALQSLAPADVDISLLHARFPLEEREKRAQAIQDKYGKDGKTRPRKGIVVGTQVLEQSLDLDFDLLVSDLAPIDLLLQRIGRLHRHERPMRKDGPHAQPYCYVNDQITKADEYIYQSVLLYQTQKALNDYPQIRLPEDYRPLVDAVYADDVLQKPEVESRDATLEEAAENYLINAPTPDEMFYEQKNRGGFREEEDGRGWLIARTRHGPESVTVILLQREGEVAIPVLAENSAPIPLNRKADRDTQLQLRRRGLRIAHKDLVKHIKSQIPGKDFALFRSPLLKHVYPLWLEPAPGRPDVFVNAETLPLPIYYHLDLGLVFGNYDEE